MKRHKHSVGGTFTMPSEAPNIYSNEKDKRTAQQGYINILGYNIPHYIAFVFACLVAFVFVYSANLFFSTLCYTYATSLEHDAPYKVVVVEKITSEELFEHYKRKGIPVKATKAIEDWPALGKWTPRWFADNFGTHKIALSFGTVEQEETILEDTTVAQYVEFMELPHKPGSNISSLPYWNEDGHFLHDEDLNIDVLDVPLLSDYPSVVDMQMFLWFGPEGTVSGAHIDTDPLNVLFQIYGTKKVWMYHPKYYQNLYPSSKYDPGAILSEVNIFKPDLQRHPKFADAKPLVVELTAGELLYIPSGWFHVVLAETNSISFSGRALTTCEALAYTWRNTLEALHFLGLYKRGNCVCHSRDESDD